MIKRHYLILVASATLSALACSSREREVNVPATPPKTPGTVHVVTDTIIEAMLDAPGVAQPYQQATLSTKLTGTVTEVFVHVGDRVSAGQALVRLDARDVEAQAARVDAGVSESDAVYRDAQTQAARIRSLFNDSAATRAQLDAAEMALARAESAVRAARAAAAELVAVTSYAVVRAPFASVVTQRLVDRGAFAAPGSPLITVQDNSRLRVTVGVAPVATRSLRRGARLRARVEGIEADAVVEGIVPASAGNVYTVNALVENATGRLPAGGAATLSIPQGTRHAILIPAAALRREGGLVGAVVRDSSGDVLRWLSVGAARGEFVEVLAGLRGGDRVIVPAVPADADIPAGTR